MSIFNKIKNLFKKEKEESEVINFNQLKNWIKNKENVNREEIIEIMGFFEKQISILIENLQDNKIILKNIDFSDNNTEERIKFIVKQNLNYYINHLEKLIINLQNIEIQQPTIIIKILDNIFIDFNKKSDMNYQKTTILIGKEIQETKNSIENFFKNTKKILDKNKKVLNTLKIISNVKINLDQLKELDKSKNIINNDLGNNLQKKNNIEDKTTDIKKIIQEIKNSDEYRKEISIKQKIIKSKQKLEKEFLILKKLINFKELYNIIHNNPKEMILIKKLQNNFQETFEQGDQENFISLLNLSKNSNNEIKNCINNINNTKQELTNLEENFEYKIDVKILLNETHQKKLNQENHELEYELTRIKRKIEKINDEKSIIIDKIKIEMNKIKIIIKD